MRRPLEWLLLLLAVVQFALSALPPGHADLISVQSLALDLSRGHDQLLYPGPGFAWNDAWVQHHEQNLRELRASGEPNWCFYPPLVPLAVAPFATASPEVWRLLWAFVQLVLIVLFILLIRRLLQAAGESRIPGAVLVTALVIGSYPVAQGIRLGQTSLLVAVLVWGGVYAGLLGRGVAKGVMVGLAAVIKPFVLLVEIVDALARRFRPAVLSVALWIALLVVSFALVGWRAHLGYWQLLTTLGSSQTAWGGNQSLLAGIVRAATDLPVLDYGFWQDPRLAMLGRVLAALLLGFAALLHWRNRTVGVIPSTGLWLSASLLALPISWEHHAVLLLPVLAWGWTQRWRGGRLVLLILATLLLELNGSPLYADAGPGRWAASLPLLGHLSLFMLLALVHRPIRPARL